MYTIWAKMINIACPSRSWWGVLDTTLCDKVCQWLVTGQWFSPGTTVSSTNQTDRHDITWNITESSVKHHKPNQPQQVWLLLDR